MKYFSCQQKFPEKYTKTSPFQLLYYDDFMQRVQFGNQNENVQNCFSLVFIFNFNKGYVLMNISPNI